VKHQMAKKMVFFSVIGTMVAMAFMVSTIIYPHPLLLVLAMSIGQGIAIFSLVLYLLGVALDLQSSGGSYISYEEPLAVEEPPATEAPTTPEATPPEEGTRPPMA
jgi:hypothetical protein